MSRIKAGDPVYFLAAGRLRPGVVLDVGRDQNENMLYVEDTVVMFPGRHYIHEHYAVICGEPITPEMRGALETIEEDLIKRLRHIRKVLKAESTER